MEVFENHQKFLDVIRNVCNGLQEFRSWYLRSPQKDPSTNCCTQVVTGKLSGVLPIAYYLLHTAAYAMAILASEWLYFSRHGIKSCILPMFNPLSGGEQLLCSPLSNFFLFHFSILAKIAIQSVSIYSPFVQTPRYQ